MFTPVHAVATWLNAFRASRACRACRDVRVAIRVSRVMLPKKRDRARHDFFLCQNAWAM